MADEVVAAGTRLCRLAEIRPGGSRSFTLGQGDWPVRGLLVRNDDQVSAFVNRCPHAGHQLNFLSDNFLTADGTLILCRSHGALFDKINGRCVFGPCVGEGLLPVPVALDDGGWIALTAAVNVDSLATRHW